MRYGRGIDKETATRFVLMYVNDYTVTLGDEGLAALTRLYTEAHRKKLIPSIPVSIPSDSGGLPRLPTVVDPAS